MRRNGRADAARPLRKTLVTCASTLDGDDEEEAAGARRVLGEISPDK